jgi:hypothetical protein
MKSRGRPIPKPIPPQSFTNLVFTCPGTGKLVEYEVPSDAAAVQQFWSRRLDLTCPHCRELHHFAYREGFIEGVLAASLPQAVAP